LIWIAQGDEGGAYVVSMAMSYAFEGNCNKAVEYEQKAFDFYGTLKNFFQQGEIADESCPHLPRLGKF
jgi:hypothetical protein